MRAPEGARPRVEVGGDALKGPFVLVGAAAPSWRKFTSLGVAIVAAEAKADRTGRPVTVTEHDPRADEFRLTINPKGGVA